MSSIIILLAFKRSQCRLYAWPGIKETRLLQFNYRILLNGCGKWHTVVYTCMPDNRPWWPGCFVGCARISININMLNISMRGWHPLAFTYSHLFYWATNLLIGQNTWMSGINFNFLLFTRVVLQKVPWWL